MAHGLTLIMKDGRRFSANHIFTTTVNVQFVHMGQVVIVAPGDVDRIEIYPSHEFCQECGRILEEEEA